ncbi:hypothetical protein [Mycoplasma sp. CSL10166]|uniref:hypothetical protein n=1 Tax=Mycoplasma sp. CSL10166 TaxID=2813825 RepID=UPI00197C19EB|nr:hypothetical protein [Mycoplasma sp. CSL10166]MBN4084445.1 hypothetical protein [Mycoplasma sp. CSL10166]
MKMNKKWKYLLKAVLLISLPLTVLSCGANEHNSNIINNDSISHSTKNNSQENIEKKYKNRIKELESNIQILISSKKSNTEKLEKTLNELSSVKKQLKDTINKLNSNNNELRQEKIDRSNKNDDNENMSAEVYKKWQDEEKTYLLSIISKYESKLNSITNDLTDEELNEFKTELGIKDEHKKSIKEELKTEINNAKAAIENFASITFGKLATEFNSNKYYVDLKKINPNSTSAMPKLVSVLNLKTFDLTGFENILNEPYLMVQDAILKLNNERNEQQLKSSGLKSYTDILNNDLEPIINKLASFGIFERKSNSYINDLYQLLRNSLSEYKEYKKKIEQRNIDYTAYETIVNEYENLIKGNLRSYQFKMIQEQDTTKRQKIMAFLGTIGKDAKVAMETSGNKVLEYKYTEATKILTDALKKLNQEINNINK